MVTKRCSILTGYLFLLLIGCSQKADKSAQPVTPVSPVASVTSVGATNLSDPLVPDSITTYRPQFGIAGTVRQFPFGPGNQPATGLRLTGLLYNGKTVRTYQYDGQGRLAQRTDYYTNGIHIFRQYTYTYGVNGIAAIATQLNKEAPTAVGYPQTSDLLPSATSLFTLPTDSLARIEKNTQTDFAVYKSELGSSRSRLGFNSKGLLVWEERIDETGKISQYTLYRPNEMGNIGLSRTGSLSNQWQMLSFTYDNKPNPFRTTGDSQPIDFSALFGVSAVTNLNNALTQSSVNSQGGRDKWRYVYEYRPDGYPYRMLSYRNEELSGTVEFVYNQ